MMQLSYARPGARPALLQFAMCVFLPGLLACGSASPSPGAPAEHENATEPAAGTSPAAKTATQATAAKAGTQASTSRKEVEKLSAEEQKRLATELRDKLRAHLKAGRGLVKQKKYQEALVELEQARVIKPNHPRVLSEIGWAAMQAGDLQRAERANLDSVRFAEDNNVKGASLYNLGRIAETRRDLQKSADYYVQSLAVRKNAIVEKRLQALKKSGVSVDDSTEHDCGFTRVQGADNATEVCEATAKSATYPGMDMALSSPSCTNTLLAKPAYQTLDIDHKALDKAVVFSIYDDDENADFVYVGARYKGAWYVSPIAYVYNPGAFGIFEDLAVKQFEARQLLPGGPPEIVVTFHKSRSDTDLGIAEKEKIEQTVVHVVGVVRGELKPLMALEAAYSFVREHMDLGDDDDDDDDDDDGNNADGDENSDHSDLPISAKSGVNYTFVPAKGQVIIRAQEDVADSKTPGTYMLSTYPEPCPRFY